LSGVLEGRVAIVTGAASGIGAATAVRMGAEGAKVVLADLDLAGARDVARSIGQSAVPRETDVGNEQAIASLVQSTVDTFGHLDILHNNAVHTFPADLDTVSTPDDVWRGMFDVIVMAAVYGCRHAIPFMVEGGGGSIICTSSGAARAATASKVAYGSAKAALESLCRYTAATFGAQGIRMNAVSPGFVLTEGTRELFDESQLETFATRAAAGRLCVPEDVADVVVFLASDAARYVNGEVVTVNGGGQRAMAW
jgi:NAD(P)-dependent dehydrogenase (short-subunit alcohol dehydrogenase family)